MGNMNLPGVRWFVVEWNSGASLPQEEVSVCLIVDEFPDLRIGLPEKSRQLIDRDRDDAGCAVRQAPGWIVASTRCSGHESVSETRNPTERRAVAKRGPQKSATWGSIRRLFALASSRFRSDRQTGLECVGVPHGDRVLTLRGLSSAEPSFALAALYATSPRMNDLVVAIKLCVVKGPRVTLDCFGAIALPF